MDVWMDAWMDEDEWTLGLIGEWMDGRMDG